MLKQFSGPPRPEQIKKYIDLVFNNRKTSLETRKLGGDLTYRAPMRAMPTTLINSKKIELPTIKEIYGEVKSLKEAYVGTVSKMAEFNAVDNLYSQFRKVADYNILNKGDRSIYYDTNKLSAPELKNWIKGQEKNGRKWYVLGRQDLSGKAIDDMSVSETPFGAMHGMAVPEVMWKSMSQHVVNDSTSVGNFARNAMGGLLWLKGISQYSKTILSPLTHIRNLTSAAMFAVAQGNIGRGANVMESLRLVSLDVVNMADDKGLAYLADLQKRGIIGSQAELREIQENLRKGVGYQKPTTRISQESTSEKPAAEMYGKDVDPILMDKISEKNMVFNFGEILNKPLRFMENAYKGEDDVWKIYNYQFEVNKLRTARAKYLSRATNPTEAKAFAKEFDETHLQGRSIDDHAADNVRNLVPNYDLSSEVIKSFRKVPLGNFVSFPAEIMRTGFNTLETAIKELSSNVPEIREIGMRRLMGSLSTFIAVPLAIKEMGMNLTGTTQEEMKAVQDLAAPYQKNSTLVPVGRDKNGHLEIYDYSHTNPYGMLIAPFTAITRSLDRDGKLERGAGAQAINAAWEGFGEIFAPFLDESMIAERLFDILPKGFPLGRDGITRTGAKVYRSGEGGDTIGDAALKSFVHMFEGLTPGGSPFRVPIGSTPKDYEMGRFIRGILAPDSKEPSTGREYNTSGELGRALLGISTQTMDWDRLGKFKAQEFKTNRSTAAGQFNRVVNKAVASSEEFVEAWKSANNARLRSFRAGRRDFLALQALGATENQVIERWKKENVGNSEINSIISNQYIPFYPSKGAFMDAADKGHIFPTDELQTLYEQFEGIPITNEEADFTLELEPDLNEKLSNYNPAPAPPVTTGAPVKTSQVSPVARDMNTRLATLLNPNDRIIAERQGRIG